MRCCPRSPCRRRSRPGSGRRCCSIGSIGIRAFGVQVAPSVDVLMTMSFDAAARAELAVVPDHVDPPGSVDLGGRQRRVAHADHAVHRLAPDQHVLPPAGAAVRRAERVDGAVVRGVRNDDGSVRLHDGLAAEPRGAAGNRRDRPPGGATVRRRAPSASRCRRRCRRTASSSCRSSGLADHVSQAIQVLSQNAARRLAAAVTGFDQVSPPSVERLTSKMMPVPPESIPRPRASQTLCSGS